MKTRIICTENLKNKIFAEIKTANINLTTTLNKKPGIAFIGFMNVPLGKYNIPFHVAVAQELGFEVFNEVLTEGTTEDELFTLIDRLNQNPEVHAIEVLQPLPTYLNPLRIVNRIKPEKEMEGFHPENMIKVLFPDIYDNQFVMCLPTALKELFEYEKVEVKEYDEWVLVLDDEFFSNPLVNMVTRTAFTNAVPNTNTLTIVNKENNKLRSYCKKADFLVVVTKDAEFIQADWLKRGVCIIDIYSNLVKEMDSKKDPDKPIPIIRGGVNVGAVKGIAGAICPIPGGLMSIVLAIMFRNALAAFKKTIASQKFVMI